MVLRMQVMARVIGVVAWVIAESAECGCLSPGMEQVQFTRKYLMSSRDLTQRHRMLWKPLLFPHIA